MKKLILLSILLCVGTMYGMQLESTDMETHVLALKKLQEEYEIVAAATHLSNLKNYSFKKPINKKKKIAVKTIAKKTKDSDSQREFVCNVLLEDGEACGISSFVRKHIFKHKQQEHPEEKNRYCTFRNCLFKTPQISRVYKNYRNDPLREHVSNYHLWGKKFSAHTCQK